MTRVVYILFIWWTFAGAETAWGQIEEGIASYYHARFHGRKTASGDPHDSEGLQAAHRTYPFGTYLRVTNLKNMKRVIVRVTDRGPFRKGRVIDVSMRAAELLGFKRAGLARVRVEVVPGETDWSTLEPLPPPLVCLPVKPFQPEPTSFRR